MIELVAVVAASRNDMETGSVVLSIDRMRTKAVNTVLGANHESALHCMIEH